MFLPLLAVSVAVTFSLDAFSRAREKAQPIALHLQPFVEDRVLAGAVTLVASRDRVLDLSTVGFAVNGDTFGHGGAYSTNLSIDPKRGLVLVFMVQNAGWRNDEGKKILPALTKMAVEAFGK